ncbi:malectin domain-containing carbohydrate-binding protein [Cyclobacterium jeungdonense]|uniref:Malectin domain-containing carbohydrate-binding protein n=1 Tax=Cyclobacterium jeungdonense TaxID=708087 RepID=A0ABT8C479_9BACT|nr:malectin domain-containing carbohydrate-binding protein [Cyclobacterium jeungdonense]MDN3686565.1 malectin domain-containing carbohydrate-binding protein [Cyclobacterium jeungdonense]
MAFSSDPGAKLVSGTSYKFSNSGASSRKRYQLERNSPDLRIMVPVENGKYTVVTFHNELWYGKKVPKASAGNRVFTISLEGKVVKNELDLF